MFEHKYRTKIGEFCNRVSYFRLDSLVSYRYLDICLGYSIRKQRKGMVLS